MILNMTFEKLKLKVAKKKKKRSFFQNRLKKVGQTKLKRKK